MCAGTIDGSIIVTGELNVNKKLENVEGTSVTNTGTINVAENATIVNPSAVVLSNEGKLVNNTNNDIVVKKITAASNTPTDLTVPGVEQAHIKAAFVIHVE